MASVNLHIYAEQITVFEVWMKSHRSSFKEEKENFYQFCESLSKFGKVKR